MLAHILVCFLAYVLWKTLAEWMQRAGLGDAPRTLLEEMAKIKSGDVVLPTVSKVGQPDKNDPPALRDRTRRRSKGATAPPRHRTPAAAATAR